jgi:uncharacterized damage-inducible protein DinB
MTGRPQADDVLADKRIEPPLAGDERATLTGFVDYQRQTLLLKCAGLTPEQLLLRAAPPSSLCLLGLVRHLTDVEYWWLHVNFGGSEDVQLYGPGDADLEVTEADEQAVTAAFARFAEVAATSRGILADTALGTLTPTDPDTGKRFSLRWILAHLIEEYARHNGHADLIRQAIDGAIGE